jgi:hypothetical protein
MNLFRLTSVTQSPHGYTTVDGVNTVPSWRIDIRDEDKQLSITHRDASRYSCLPQVSASLRKSPQVSTSLGRSLSRVSEESQQVSLSVPTESRQVSTRSAGDDRRRPQSEEQRTLIGARWRVDVADLRRHRVHRLRNTAVHSPKGMARPSMPCQRPCPLKSDSKQPCLWRSDEHFASGYVTVVL